MIWHEIILPTTPGRGGRTTPLLLEAKPSYPCEREKICRFHLQWRNQLVRDPSSKPPSAGQAPASKEPFLPNAFHGPFPSGSSFLWWGGGSSFLPVSSCLRVTPVKRTLVQAPHATPHHATPRVIIPPHWSAQQQTWSNIMCSVCVCLCVRLKCYFGSRHWPKQSAKDKLICIKGTKENVLSLKIDLPEMLFHWFSKEFFRLLLFSFISDILSLWC